MDKRRDLLKYLVLAPALTAFNTIPIYSQNKPVNPGRRYKISLNAYSFNELLRKGEMSLSDLLHFCALHQFDGVDLTAYYFPGYPAVPSDDYLYNIKHQAFKLGLGISGTGVRNDFTDPDQAKRQEGITLVKNWIDAASKLGAPVIRIFSGTQTPPGYTWNQITTWMVKDIKECVAYGKSKGVVVAIQNHHDFIKTADQTIQIMKSVNSEWFGLILDIGSYRQDNPYDEIGKVIPYAVSWQLKEKIYVREVETDPDLKKLAKIIKASNYRGYLPIESLGPGDPKIKVPAFLAQVKKALYETE